VITNAEAAERFEAQFPSGAVLDAERQKPLLAALASAGRELALGRLPEAERALKPFDALTDAELDFLRGSLAPKLFNACVMRALILQRNDQPDAASAAMQRCVATYPGTKPPAQPEIQHLFEQAQSAMAFAPLTVQAPAGCIVRLFGVAVGRSPLRMLPVATGQTPVQLECTEEVPGRRHIVNVKAGANSIEIDPRFERSVTSHEALQLIYDQRAALLSHARIDADVLGDALHARVIVVEKDDANPSYTVTAPAGAAAELGKLHYGMDSGADRGDLLRIVDGLRYGAVGLNTTAARGTDGSTPESNNPARAAPAGRDAKDSGSVVQPVVGAALGVLGIGGLVTGWALYAERQDYRLEARPEISDDVMRGFDQRGAWMLAIGGTAAAGLVAAEYLLLPRTDAVPVAAWVAGAVGVAGAAVGLAYAVSSDNCEPMAVVAGERTSRACYARTSDGMFGPMLMLSSLPLLNVPLVYLLRSWLGTSAAGTVSLTPSDFTVRGSF
jgi:hypothetical protein